MLSGLDGLALIVEHIMNTNLQLFFVMRRFVLLKKVKKNENV